MLLGGMIAGLFGLALPWLVGKPMPPWPWGVGGALMLWAIAAPATLRPVYRLWMRLGLLLNRITTPVILAAAFFCLIMPAGLLLRLFGKDPMARAFDPGSRTYRSRSRQPSKQDMEKPY